MKRGIFLIFLFAYFFIGCSKNAPVSSKKIHFPGLEGNSKVYVDKWGIYHIYADSDDDLFYIQGYLEAKSRFFYLDFLRHLSRGDLGAIVSNMIPLITEFDKFVKESIYGPDGRSSLVKTYEGTPPKIRKQIDRFVDGVNAYIMRLKEGKEDLPKDYKNYDLGLDFIEKWSPYDSIAIGRFALLALSSIRTVDWKINRALWEDKLPPRIREDWIRWKEPTRTSILFGSQSFNNSPPVPTHFSYDALKSFSDRLASIMKAFGITGFVGSNNWVWSGKITTDRNVIVSNDPHLPLLTPPVWQGFYLDSKTYGKGKMRVMGYAVSGVPSIMIGFNESLAWGVTMTGYDVSDVWAQDIYKGSDGHYYARKAGGDVQLKSVEAPYKLRTGKDSWFNTVMQIYYIPGDSVLIMWDNKAFDPFGKPPTSSTAISFRWPGYDATHEFEAYYYLMTASTVDDFFRAISYFGVGAQNFVMGNKYGDIAYDPHALIPIRAPGSRPWRLMDGVNNEGKWLGYVPDNKLPRLVNPERGYIASANNDIFGYLHGEDFEPPYTYNGTYYYFSKWPGYRAARIDYLIRLGKEINSLDIDYSRRMQKDVYSIMAEQFVPVILKAAENHPDLIAQWSTNSDVNYNDAVDLLRKWSYYVYSGIPYWGIDYDGQMKLDSAASSIFEAWLKYMKKVVYEDEAEKYDVPLPETGLPCTYIKSLYYILTEKKDSPLFDNVYTTSVTETHDYDILYALKLAVDKMLELQKVSSVYDLRWGNLHKTVMFSPGLLDSRLGYPADGDSFTINNGGMLSADNVNNYLHIDGASARLIVEIGPDGPVKAYGILPGSQQEDWRNDFDQFPMWERGDLLPLIFNEKDLKGNVKKVIYFAK